MNARLAAAAPGRASPLGVARSSGVLLGAAIAVVDASGTAGAQSPDSAPERPAIAFYRWQEDWSVLADPRVRREPLDGLKYIRLGADSARYLSFGADFRQRYEGNGAPSFGAGGTAGQAYVLSRLEVHADLRLRGFQTFVQVADHRAPGQLRPGPVSQDVLDLEEGFVGVTAPAAGGTLKLRAGRQQFAFDLQRFVSVRDGANVRQSYDALWGDYERGRWRTIAFWSHPVQNRDLRAFDDFSNRHLAYGGVRLERNRVGPGAVSAYYSRFVQDGATYLTVSGLERRDILDVRYAGKARGVDWDLEGMSQRGSVGAERVRAWAVGTLAGYTLADRWAAPRLGLQVDAASGDRDPHDGRFGTFNPLFPNGYYVTLSGYTGYTNLVHVKPSLTLKPAAGVTVLAATGLQWRVATADAVYTQPNVPVPGTAGRGGAWTGQYVQFRTDWAATRSLALAVEAVHFGVGGAVRGAGGHDANYLGVQVGAGW